LEKANLRLLIIKKYAFMINNRSDKDLLIISARSGETGIYEIKKT